jgi:hypothetical protein
MFKYLQAYEFPKSESYHCCYTTIARQAGHLHVYGTTRKAFCADPGRYGSAPDYAVDLP